MDLPEDEPLLAEEIAVSDAGAELSDVARVCEGITARDSEWAAGEALTLGTLSWKPDLIRPAQMDGEEQKRPPAALHIHLAERLRPYALERIRAARDDGLEPHLALPLASLYDEELLLAIHDLDPSAHVITDSDMNVAAADSLLGALCDRGVVVSNATRKTLAQTALALSQDKTASSQVRGRRYEALLAFLLSQVGDFAVVERNYRTETEEIDSVVQIRSTMGRVWTGLGAPMILVEAKNWKDKVPQTQVSAFRVKMMGRRRTVRIGLMFGASGFTSDAYDQELRFSGEDLTIVIVTPDELAEWIETADPDDYVEALVRRAMLR